LKVSHIVTRPLSTIAANGTLLSAAKILVENNIGLLVVVQAPGELIGVISERDIIRVVASGGKLETQVINVCTRDVVTVRASADVAEAAKAMNRHRIRHVVVVDDMKKPVGVVSMRDLVGERATLTAILQSNEKEVFHGAD
jgi:CBS domain-containing protein